MVLDLRIVLFTSWCQGPPVCLRDELLLHARDFCIILGEWREGAAGVITVVLDLVFGLPQTWRLFLTNKNGDNELGHGVFHSSERGGSPVLLLLISHQHPYLRRFGLAVPV